MNRITEKLLILSYCRGIYAAKIRKIYQMDPSFRLLLHLKPSEYASMGLVAPSSYSVFIKDFTSLKAADIQKKLNDSKISFITIADPSYPVLLKEIPDPPVSLFCRGDMSLMTAEHILGVAGARNATSYGKRALAKVLVPLIQKGFIIVSGLASGIDTAAHALSIQYGGKTIAVLGGGFGHIYPASNYAIAEEIGKNHLLLTEYAPHIKPQKWHFPERNRLISGLGSGTLIAEARERSGSLITAQCALEQGREVFAIPGSILDRSSAGTNELLKDGAKLVMGYEDILEEIKTFH
ncbi:DNA-protecting protein DprA [Bacillus sp. FJAT-42376]|uniref:DNA-processing protein DprA n=1 Tax=Bacillus sp. FJAT-42376 TaxID=2014076 RepID=UPI000F4EA0FB|nr:DNA-processing protein DprA [Bacillus sp. FJAT-42376]AZB42927.1 DNA-protecting protein DprA [Bacillus sp. FJAT-42376]